MFLSPWLLAKFVLIPALLGGMPVTAQTSASMTSGSRSDASRAEVQKAFAQLQHADADQSRFTRLHTENNTVTEANGKVIAQSTKLFEDTWINDLPYKHLLELNGKPLTGKALADETARYDAAVADRRALDTKARAKLMGGKVFAVPPDYSSASNPLYSIEELPPYACGKTTCAHYRIAPAPGSEDKIKGQLRISELWIERDTDKIAKFSYQLLRNEGSAQKGSSALIEWGDVDGSRVVLHSLLTPIIRTVFQTVKITTDNRYTQYRRFRTSVNIVDVPASDGVPNEQSVPASPK